METKQACVAIAIEVKQMQKSCDSHGMWKYWQNRTDLRTFQFVFKLHKFVELRFEIDFGTPEQKVYSTLKNAFGGK